ncbi:MAG: orotidine-5'-phosphate decarboxylase [Thiohalospira sp.]
MPEPRIPVIIALDFPVSAQALDLARQLDPAVCRVKVGKELFTRGGPAVVEELTGLGFGVFLDLKYHDIPATVAGACRAAAELGVWTVNVHALGGRRMVEAAAEALAGARRPPLLTAVTVLTSMEGEDLREIGLAGTPRENVLRLGHLALESGADGLVCSAREVTDLRCAFGVEPCLVTPGIRPADAVGDDQRRVVTPAEARRAGADHLVVGRPVTGAADPAAALRALEAEVGGL